MADLSLRIPPIAASAGGVSIVNRTITDVWGSWSVTWPSDMDNKPDLGMQRTFGYLAKLDPDNHYGGGLFSRRFVRRDISIDAREKGGWSNAELQLDDAKRQLSGDVVFSRTVGAEPLGSLAPHQAFRVGDIVPVQVWDFLIPAVCESIRRVVENGVTSWECRFGRSLVAEPSVLEAANAERMRELERERVQIIEALKAAAESGGK